jgi:hypothetical protein
MKALLDGGGEASLVAAHECGENVDWLRERVRQFRKRAERATDENLRARLLHAAAIYEREAEAWETREAQRAPELAPPS